MWTLQRSPAVHRLTVAEEVHGFITPIGNPPDSVSEGLVGDLLESRVRLGGGLGVNTGRNNDRPTVSEHIEKTQSTSPGAPLLDKCVAVSPPLVPAAYSSHGRRAHDSAGHREATLASAPASWNR